MSKQLHFGKLQGHGKAVSCGIDTLLWCGLWRNRTAAELHAECLTIIADLEKRYPSLATARTEWANNDA